MADQPQNWLQGLVSIGGVAAIASLSAAIASMLTWFTTHKFQSASAQERIAQAKKTQAETPTAQAIALDSVLKALEGLSKTLEAERQASGEHINRLCSEVEGLKTEIQGLDGQIIEMRSGFAVIYDALANFDKNCGACPNKPVLPLSLAAKLRHSLVEDHGGGARVCGIGAIAET